MAFQRCLKGASPYKKSADFVFKAAHAFECASKLEGALALYALVITICTAPNGFTSITENQYHLAVFRSAVIMKVNGDAKGSISYFKYTLDQSVPRPYQEKHVGFQMIHAFELVATNPSALRKELFENDQKLENALKRATEPKLASVGNVGPRNSLTYTSSLQWTSSPEEWWAQGAFFLKMEDYLFACESFRVALQHSKKQPRPHPSHMKWADYVTACVRCCRWVDAVASAEKSFYQDILNGQTRSLLLEFKPRKWELTFKKQDMAAATLERFFRILIARKRARKVLDLIRRRIERNEIIIERCVAKLHGCSRKLVIKYWAAITRVTLNVKKMAKSNAMKLVQRLVDAWKYYTANKLAIETEILSILVQAGVRGFLARKFVVMYRQKEERKRYLVAQFMRKLDSGVERVSFCGWKQIYELTKFARSEIEQRIRARHNKMVTKKHFLGLKTIVVQRKESKRRFMNIMKSVEASSFYRWKSFWQEALEMKRQAVVKLQNILRRNKAQITYAVLRLEHRAKANYLKAKKMMQEREQAEARAKQMLEEEDARAKKSLEEQKIKDALDFPDLFSFEDDVAEEVVKAPRLSPELLVQSCWRMYSNRKVYIVKHKAILKLQCFIRCVQMKLHVMGLRRLKATILIQSCVRRNQCVKPFRLMAMRNFEFALAEHEMKSKYRFVELWKYAYHDYEQTMLPKLKPIPREKLYPIVKEEHHSSTEQQKGSSRQLERSRSAESQRKKELMDSELGLDFGVTNDLGRSCLSEAKIQALYLAPSHPLFKKTNKTPKKGNKRKKSKTTHGKSQTSHNNQDHYSNSFEDIPAIDKRLQEEQFPLQHSETLPALPTISYVSVGTVDKRSPKKQITKISEKQRRYRLKNGGIFIPSGDGASVQDQSLLYSMAKLRQRKNNGF